MSRNSSSETSAHVLAVNKRITTRVARSFLEELANTSNDPAALDRFVQKFRRFFGEQIPWQALDGWARIGEQAGYEHLGPADKLHNYWLIPLRDAVRTVWCLPDLRSKRLAVYTIVTKLLYPSEPRFHPEPLHDPRVFSVESFGEASNLERALEELVSERSHHLACKCLNPDCHSPFFFASRKSRRYCSDACALPAQQEAKRRWWTEHGKKWRADREGVAKQRIAEGSKAQRTVGNVRPKG